MRAALTTVGEVAGLALITYGLWLISPPVAFIFGGAAVGFVSFWLGRDR